MNSLERVAATMEHKEPDRVPIFLFLLEHGSRELNLSIQEYFSKPENIFEGQVRMQKKFGHDCVYGFICAAAEAQAFGVDVMYVEDGPPNAGQPVISRVDQIEELAVPWPEDSELCRNTLKAIELLNREFSGKVPIVSVVVSPLSLPIMLMGFEMWLRLLSEENPMVKKMLSVAEEFCLSWANAQIKAGATALGFFDPLASSTMLTREEYRKYGLASAQKVISAIGVPVVYALAAAHAGGSLDLIAKTGAVGVTLGSKDDLGKAKQQFGDRLFLLGNLDGISMVSWNVREAEEAVRNCISKAAPGGGFILSDGHGEIPFQVSDEILFAVVEAVKEWGTYPMPRKSS